MSEHADELEHADPAELEQVDVDPANGTEPYDAGRAAAPTSGSDAARAPLIDPGPDAAAAAPGYTAPEKITSVVKAVLARPGEPKVRALLAVITSPLGDRLLLRPMLAMVPPLDQPGEWDEWLGLLAGCALELASDGVTVDVDQARADARFMLAALFAGEADG